MKTFEVHLLRSYHSATHLFFLVARPSGMGHLLLFATRALV